MITCWTYTDNMELFFSNEDALDSENLCILLDNLTETDFIKLNYSKSTISFFLTHQFIDRLSESRSQEFFIRSVFNSNYFKIFKRPVFFLESKINKTSLDNFEHMCRNHGYTDTILLSPFMSDENQNNHHLVNYLLHAGGEMPVPTMNAYLEKWINDPKKRFETGIHVVTRNHINPTYDPLLHKTATILYQIGQSNYKNCILLHASNEKLSNLEKYLTIHRGRSHEVLEFYYKEYEILPDWFKKLGHIIKVLMGKRSLSSLFNDNLKKNKN